MSPEMHRRSKSILKKHNSGVNLSNGAGSGHHYNHRNGSKNVDPEMEKLISDNTSAASGSEYSPARCVPIVFRNSGAGNNHAMTADVFKQIAATGSSAMNTNTIATTPISTKYKLIGIPNNIVNAINPSDVVLLQDLFGNATAHTATGGTPLYICPPPPPMEQFSTNEEDNNLLLLSRKNNFKKYGNNPTAVTTNAASAATTSTASNNCSSSVRYL